MLASLHSLVCFNYQGEKSLIQVKGEMADQEEQRARALHEQVHYVGKCPEIVFVQMRRTVRARSSSSRFVTDIRFCYE